MTSDLIAGFLSGAVLIIAIGAQNSFVLRQGIRREHVLAVVLTCAFADIFLIAAGVAGVGELIQSAPLLLVVTRYGGAIFLLAYGWRAAQRAFHPETLNVDTQVGSSLSVALGMCAAFTFLNPHVYLDTVILLGSLANQRGASERWYFWAGASMSSITWFFALGFGARFLSPLFSQPRAWRILDSFIAATMFVLGGMLLSS
ncbi:L-lysine exporter family protein LysE/ArgO [Oxalobacteraceae bacterium GrIS 2.11]